MVRIAEETKKAEKRFCPVKNVRPRWDEVFDSGDIATLAGYGAGDPSVPFEGSTSLVEPNCGGRGVGSGREREEDVAG